VDASAVGVAAGILLISAAAVVVSSIAVSPSTVTAGTTVVISGTVPATGSASCLNSTPASDYRVGLRGGGGDPGVHPTLRVIDQATRFATRAPQPGPSGTDRSAEIARWRVIAGVSIIGVAAFLGVAQWQPKRRRKD
jgi:hypothetical protein